jgi:hypothetical protein
VSRGEKAKCSENRKKCAGERSDPMWIMSDTIPANGNQGTSATKTQEGNTYYHVGEMVPKHYGKYPGLCQLQEENSHFSFRNNHMEKYKPYSKLYSIRIELSKAFKAFFHRSSIRNIRRAIFTL